MERVAMTALEADVLKLAIAAVVVLAVALVLIVYFGARAIQGILGAQSKLLDAYQQIATAIHQLMTTLNALTNDIRLFQQTQTAAFATMHGDLKQHITTSETRHHTIVEQIEIASKRQVDRLETLKTDLEGVAGRMIDSSVEQMSKKVGEAVQPLLQDFGVIRTSLEQIEARRMEEKVRRETEDAQYRAEIRAVWEKVADTQQKLVQTVGSTIINERGTSNEDTQQQNVVGGPNLPDTGMLNDPGGRAGQSSGSDGGAAGDGGAATSDPATGGAATGGAAASDSAGPDTAGESNNGN